jgi:hypothetical protein
MSLAILASLAGGAIQAIGAGKAAKAQEKQAAQQMALQKGMYEDQTQNLAPWLGTGTTAQNALAWEMGLGSRPMIGGTAPQIETFTVGGQQQSGGYGGDLAGAFFGGGALPIGDNRMPSGGTGSRTMYRVNGQTFGTLADAQAYANANLTGGKAYGGFKETPGYKFALGQGLDAVQSSAAARGGLYSGNAMTSMNDYAQGMANQEYGNYYNRLAGIAGNGQNAAAMQGAAGQNYVTGATNALGSIGDARAAGAVGFGNAINDGITNAIGAWQYGQTANPSANKSPWKM